MPSLSYVGLICFLLGERIQALSVPSTSTLPVVDLGYTRQEAASFNSSGGYYNFTNIRYGEPPVGSLRFAAPVPAKENRTIQRGGSERMCMQANPAWTLLAAKWLPAYVSDNKPAISNFLANPPEIDPALTIPPVGQYETEDCLFLDVSVPQTIFTQRNSTNSTTSRNQTKGAPVMVWIFGGGYAFGSKNYWGSGAGLLDRSDDGMIYVSINYRLGAFGWLSGPTFEAGNGTANAGLLDQRLALDWVQKYIHLFGGDPNQITVVGESAGAGSIMHHITAYGGTKGPAPFQRAVTQSAAWLPITSNRTEDLNFQEVLAKTNTTTLEELRSLPLDAIRAANSIIVASSPYGQYSFGPVVDGTYVPELPGKLLLNGSFDKNVELMVGHNANEGLRFTSPFLQNGTEIRKSLETTFPTATPSTLDYILQKLYPPISPLYNTSLARAALIVSEATFSCNARYLARAFGHSSYNYLFAVPPALHGQDIPYTFYNGPAPSVLAPAVALTLQTYITQFVKTGVPSGNQSTVAPFEPYGNGTVRRLGPTGSGPTYVSDPTENQRCDWWQQAFYEVRH